MSILSEIIEDKYELIPKEEFAELKRLVVREAQHHTDCRVWLNHKGTVERCTCWKAKAFKILGVEVNK